MKPIYRLWIGLGILALLSPLGLLAVGTAWGEWSPEELAQRLGVPPIGVKQLSETWRAWFPNYSISGPHTTFWHSAVGYVLSALIGIVVIAGLCFLLGRVLAKREDAEDSH